jgi:hypothetical protein
MYFYDEKHFHNDVLVFKTPTGKLNAVCRKSARCAMEAEMRSLGIDPEAAMQRVAEVLSGRNRMGGLNFSQHAELKAYFKTPRLHELFKFAQGRGRSIEEHGQALKKKKSEDYVNDGPEKTKLL